jgi:NAD(P)H-hydrate epimerase
VKKVVTAEEMARIEKVAISHGSSAEDFMQAAGVKVANAAERLLHKTGGKRVVILTGPGNKGGDAYVAGMHLLKAGYSVRAVAFAKEADCSSLNQRFAKQFSGQISHNTDFSADDLIIDGLFGTGFHGSIEEGPIGQVIESANQSGKPILAIDIPSGLHGTTGIAEGFRIVATETVTLGFAKSGLFRGSGWDCIGKLHIEDFGLPQEAIDAAKAIAYIPDIYELKLPPMARSHHKYERGSVVGLGGSLHFKGAVKLSGAAALHAGAGIVKLFTLDDVGPMADELIAELWEPEAWKEAVKKATALFIGPGLGRTAKAKKACKAALQTADVPLVLDADALFFLPEIAASLKDCVLTPHRGEALHLLELGKVDEEMLFSRCQEYVDTHGVVFVLKGAPTYIFRAGDLPIIVPRGDPGMATAGSGDVLTGIIAALLAQGQSPLDAAVLGVMLHALAGEAAALDKTSYGYSASDLIEYLPSAFKLF